MSGKCFCSVLMKVRFICFSVYLKRKNFFHQLLITKPYHIQPQSPILMDFLDFISLLLKHN